MLHEVIGTFLVPKLEKSTSLYGSLGATTTFIFFMYLVGILVVLAAVLNSSLHDELSRGAVRSQTISGRPTPWRPRTRLIRLV